MLYVELKNNSHMSWHVGEMPPKDMMESTSIFTITVDDVVMIQADNDELDYIVDKFGVSAMRPKNTQVVKWYGDIAKFIVGNL